MRKRLIALLVAVLMAFGLVPAAALARTEAPVPADEPTLNEALNVEGGMLSFISPGDYPWTVITEDDRVYAQSGNAGVASSVSSLSMTSYVGSNMAIHFDFKAWGEGGSNVWDKCVFMIDGNEIFKYGALDNDWTEYVVNVTAGAHTFVWNYSKDSSANPAGDYFAVDNVRFEEREALPINEELDAAVNAEGGNIHFYTSGEYLWTVVTDEENGRIFARSGNAGVNSSVSEMTATVDFENDSTITFDYMAWGEGTGGEVGLRSIWDHCRFYVDSTAVLDLGALDNDWQSFSYDLAAGEHELKWSYQKDSSQHPEGDYFAVDNVAITGGEPEDYSIGAIEIGGFTAPVYGAHPDIDVTVPEGAHYQILTSSWNWLYDGFGNTVDATETFDNGDYDYYQFFEVVADEGYYFADGVTVTINGDEALVGDHGFDGGPNYQYVNSVYFKVDAPEPDVIDAIEIEDFTVPAWGEHPDFEVSVPEGAHYTIDYVDWSWFGGGFGVMTADDVFDNPAATYTMYVQLIPEEGWILADDAVFTINGESALVDPMGCGYQGGSHPYIYVNSIGFTVEEAPAEPTEITEINVVGFVTPEAGMTGAEFMALSVPADANYYISTITAYNNTTGQPLTAEDVLEEGSTYIVGAYVVPNDGYCFAEDAVLLANGGTELINTDYSCVEDPESAWVVMNEYTIPAVPSTIFIDTIYVNGIETEPVAGENADDHLGSIVIPDGEPYTIQYTRWFDEDSISGFHDAFIAGGHYSVNVSVGLPEGYAFAENVTVYVNGDTSLVSTYTYNYGDSFAFYTIPFECVEPEPVSTLGDVDLDGEITVSDALLAMRYAMGVIELTDEQLAQMDVNGDGVYDLVDATLIIRCAMGIIDCFPADEPRLG